ncbi:MAG: carboxypeptidase regulatory-like domain-containing protein [Deltaproteobacteria bacterium]|nr:carboxypeptidase regulatory-like domain-containing protein [Deltaproteobacteria bacterium]MBW2211984.1 carboxypeptidase regulatory-like domain-containing protein [Deltaproteobacteria bacterium]MBW2685979.1 carboxypeptidase regulatory-like domain-containing protein [Deltaproteobacteria bacterium]
MRAAGAITGLLVLGTFVIPGTYGAKTELISEAQWATGVRSVSPGELDAGSATLAGRIYDEGGRPLAGATVSLAGSGFWPARSVRSGADGRFYWPQIPAGIYELRASKGRLVAPPVEGLILDAGARRAFGIQLGRGWTLAGRVVDAHSGRAIRDAEVTIATGVLGLHTRRTRSDDGGQFELTGIVGDEHSLYVGADGYVAAGPLRHSETEPPMTVRLERASTIEGRVVDERGWALEGVLIRAFGEGDLRAASPGATDSLGVTSGPVPPISAGGSGALAFVQQVTTSRDGAFVLSSLRPGPYTITASHDDFAPAESERLQVGPGRTRAGVDIVMRSGAELAGRVVDERGNGLEGIPVELRASTERVPRMSVTASDGSFSFRGVRGGVSVTALPYDLPPARESLDVGDEELVTIELALSRALYTLRGRVVDEGGFGVGGALLTVSAKSPQTPIRRTAKSDADGSFSVPALPEPPFDLSAEHPGFSQAILADIDSMDDVRVVMSAGVTFLGEVLDDWTGDALGSVQVRLDGPAKRDTMTRSDGTFVFRRTPTGTYDISFSHPSYEPQSRRVVLEPPHYVDRPQELATVRLEPGGTVVGEVLDALSDPVSNAEVTWGDPPRWERATLSDAHGEFRLRGVPAGSVWITARHPVAGEDWTVDPITVRPLETSPGAVVRLPNSIDE